MLDHCRVQLRPLKINDSIPESEWKRPRREYFQEGKTLAQLAEKHFLDYRTVRRLIQQNDDWDDLNKHPSALDPYKPMIIEIMEHTRSPSPIGITTISIRIHETLREAGYTGSERTVRNYIRSLQGTAAGKEAPSFSVLTDDAER